MGYDERRTNQRVTFPVLVLFRNGSTASFESAYATDLSSGGLRVDGSHAEPGALIDLQLVERDGRRPLEVLGEVVRVDDSGFAVRFVDLDPAQRAWIEGVVQGRTRSVELGPTEDLLEKGFDEV